MPTATETAAIALILRRASGAPPRVISDSMAKPLARRFYKEASIGDVAPFQILLDGRTVKTPKKRHLARADAGRSPRQSPRNGGRKKTLVDPRSMPLTRFANTAIDAVERRSDAVAADIVAYAGSDLLCYRAEAPETLVRCSREHWDPIVAWAANEPRRVAQGRAGRDARRATAGSALGRRSRAYAARCVPADRACMC